MKTIPRRTFLAGAGSATMLTAACGNGVGSNGAATIDARVDNTLNFLYSTYPNTLELRDKSVGILVMPLVTKAGLGIGGSFGRGALRINNASVDYYSAGTASIGFQAGAQQFSHAIFFMTEDALADFRTSPGWAAGAGAEYVLRDTGQNVSTGTTTVLTPAIALIFGQAGISVGATIEGTKYTRIIP